MDQTNSGNRAAVDRVVHTPGPWTVSRSGRGVSAAGIRISQASGPCAASVSVQRQIDAELRANARLIAAAPELAECLRGLYDVQNGVPLGKYESEWNALMDKAEELFQRLGV